jgi:hypothetical protein
MSPKKNAPGQKGALQNLTITTTLAKPGDSSNPVNGRKTTTQGLTDNLAIFARFQPNERHAVYAAFHIAFVVKRDGTTLQDVLTCSGRHLNTDRAGDLGSSFDAKFATHMEEATGALAYFASRRHWDAAIREGIRTEYRGYQLIAKFDEDAVWSYAIAQSERRGDSRSADQLREDQSLEWQGQTSAEQNMRLMMSVLYNGPREFYAGYLTRKLFITPYPGAYGHAGYIVTVEGSPPKGTLLIQGGSEDGSHVDVVIFMGSRPKAFLDHGPYAVTAASRRDMDVRGIVQAFIVERMAHHPRSGS